MSEHTPGPWEVYAYHSEPVGKWPGIDARKSRQSIVCYGDGDEFDRGIHGLDHNQALANARRIVACVNACEGIDTDRLESGSPEWWGRYVRDDRPAMEREIKQLQARAYRLAELMEWFCHRVEIGEVGSKTTYERFRAALAGRP